MSSEQDKPSAPQRREQPDPREGSFPVPMSIILLALLAAVWSLFYILSADVGSPTLGDGRELAALSQAAPAAADGASLFSSNCRACHQANGQGLPTVFPPLAGSEWVQGPAGRLAKIVLIGVAGNLSVKGQAYNGIMPTFSAKFSDAELAALLTYIRSSWGNGAPAVDAATVKSARDASHDRNTPWQGDELSGLQ